MDDLLLCGGIVAGHRQDIALHQGRIRQIAARSCASRTDAGYSVINWCLPGFVESHIHPDKAFVADRAPGLRRQDQRHRSF